MTTDNKTLAGVQPGGRVRLGDQLVLAKLVGAAGLMLAEIDTCGHEVDPAYRHTLYEAWEEGKAALSAQPSPGGQGVGASISDDDRAVLQRLQDALPTAGINGWAKGVEVLERLLRDSLAARQPVGVTNEVIREVFMRNGFTIKDGQSDLKPYVYAAARELLEVARQPVGEPERRAPVQGYHGETIPWRVHGLAWEAYAKKYGNRQSAERLAERGGFGVEEMDMFLPGWRDMVEGPTTQAVDVSAVRTLLQRRIEQWRSHLPADPSAPGTREIETKGEHDYNNDVRIYREGIAVMDEVLSLIDSGTVQNAQAVDLGQFIPKRKPGPDSYEEGDSEAHYNSGWNDCRDAVEALIDSQAVRNG